MQIVSICYNIDTWQKTAKTSAASLEIGMRLLLILDLVLENTLIEKSKQVNVLAEAK